MLAPIGASNRKPLPLGMGYITDTIAYIAAAVIALVAGGYGLGKVMFERGYVQGYDDCEHKDEVVFVAEE